MGRDLDRCGRSRPALPFAQVLANPDLGASLRRVPRSVEVAGVVSVGGGLGAGRAVAAFEAGHVAFIVMTPPPGRGGRRLMQPRRGRRNRSRRARYSAVTPSTSTALTVSSTRRSRYASSAASQSEHKRPASVTPEAGRPNQVSPPLRRARCVAASCIVVSRLLSPHPGHLLLRPAVQAVRQPAAQPDRQAAPKPSGIRYGWSLRPPFVIPTCRLSPCPESRATTPSAQPPDSSLHQPEPNVIPS